MMVEGTKLTRNRGIRLDIILHTLLPTQSLIVVNHIPNQNTPALLNISLDIRRQRPQLCKVNLWDDLSDSACMRNSERKSDR